jgi:TonB family protein
VRGTLARRRVESGLTHTYFNDVGRVLLGRFRQGQAEVERGMTAQEKVAQKLSDISSALSHSGTLEDPLADPRRPDPLVNSPSGHPSLAEAQKRLAYSLPYKWTHSEGVAVVRLTQAPDGKVLSIELITHSGNAGLDRAAELAIRDLGEALPPLPPEVLQGREAVVSEWKFELLRSVASPSAMGVGVVGTFDATTGVAEALPSFAGRSQARVTLVAYY